MLLKSAASSVLVLARSVLASIDIEISKRVSEEQYTERETIPRNDFDTSDNLTRNRDPILKRPLVRQKKARSAHSRRVDLDFANDEVVDVGVLSFSPNYHQYHNQQQRSLRGDGDDSCPAFCPREVCDCSYHHLYEQMDNEDLNKRCGKIRAAACRADVFTQNCKGEPAAPIEQHVPEAACELYVCLDENGEAPLCNLEEEPCKTCYCNHYINMCRDVSALCEKGPVIATRRLHIRAGDDLCLDALEEICQYAEDCGYVRTNGADGLIVGANIDDDNSSSSSSSSRRQCHTSSSSVGIIRIAAYMLLLPAMWSQFGHYV